MKRIIYAFSLSILFACSNSSNNDDKLKQDNVAIVEKYIQAVQNRDVRAMSDLLSDDYTGFGPGFSDSIDKKSAIENFQNLASNLYDKISYTQSLNIAAEVKDGPRPGNYVSNWAHLTITYKDGRGPVNLYANTAYRIENGKITNTRTIYDEADAQRQLAQ
jgi:ketosteroid isomerase-like protein